MRVASIAVILAMAATRAGADALVVTQAMRATTIAEIFVESDRIRVEMEIGAVDAQAFANCLPDELFREIRSEGDTLAQRRQTFLTQDWGIAVEGLPLPGKVERVKRGKRVARDTVTGDPLADQPEDAEQVIRVELTYQLETQPTSLTIRPPMKGDAAAASIGFVCFHRGLPVNDFRYLFDTQTLDLDWEDPWYSHFRHPNLKRQFDAPLSAFLYVEPYEVRKEIIVRPRDLQDLMDFRLPEDGMISVAQQKRLKEKIGEFLVNNSPVTIDGRSVEGRLDRIHFIRRTLRTTGIIEPPVDLESVSATLGAIIVYPIDALPQRVTMTCELFTPKIQSVPGVASDEAGGLPATMTPDDPVLAWKNVLTNPTSTELIRVSSPPAKKRLSIPFVSVLCGGVLIALLAWNGWRLRTGQNVLRFSATAFIGSVAFGFVAFPFARVSVSNPFDEQPTQSDDKSAEILAAVLQNVYRSFDHHNESLIYDRLAHSISGDLLAEVYLETRKSMEIKNQGGLCISVKDVSITQLETLRDDHSEREFRCGWRVAGSIGHWGHLHARENLHMARITLADRDGEWKITEMEMLEEDFIGADQS